LVEILSQAEIEALLSSLTSDGEQIGVDPESDGAQAGGPDVRSFAKRDDKMPVAYEAYDFRRPDKLSKDQLRTLQMLHETFARLFASSLSAYLRVSAHVDLVSVEQLPYNEYMRSLTSSIITVVSMEPLVGQALVEVEFNVVLSMLDRLLGGPGNMVKNSNVLTEIEKALTESIVNRALAEFKNAWDNVVQFFPRREGMETQAQFIQIVPPNDTVVSILFEIKIGDQRGAMSICIPYLVLKPLTAKLSAQRWFASAHLENVGKNAETLAKRLETTRVTCACRLGTAEISVQELMDLKVDDTLVLNRRCTDEVDMLIGGQIKFKGKPGTSGRKVALHINRVISK
jgi:flagellar motor switch protein FliM